ncbi:hypothetical protein [Nocardioides sp. AX2bis]|uniref:hypothetical protein n=1 Tax=Nocardioides sp. AX2bis TaxID=2653157 RepID=UPI0012EFF97C|nr:hypothetical protein [Nocardioides sp. AX2bis]VXC01402.1 exported hypothetical protein [Nocardioides sp. AX2bis]
MRTALAPVTTLLRLLTVLALLTAAAAGPSVAAEATPGAGPASFLPATASRLDVVVPADAGSGTVRAGLAAVGALAARYPTASIGLRADDAEVPDVAGDQRVVALLHSPGPVRRTVRTVDGVPALALRGRAPDLLVAARALAGPDARPSGEGIAVDPGTTGTDPVTAARRAAPVVAALQQATTRVLRVGLVAPGTLVGGQRSGVLVGATTADAAAVGAPLGLRASSGLPDVARGSAYAALQSVDDGGRRLLLLGGWAPRDAEGDRLLERLLDRAAYTAGTTGWDGRGEESLVVTAGEDPLVLAAPTGPAAAPQEKSQEQSQEQSQEGSAGRWWFVGGVLALLVALAARGVVTVARPRR